MLFTEEQLVVLQYWKHSSEPYYREFDIPKEIFELFDKDFFIFFGKEMVRIFPEAFPINAEAKKCGINNETTFSATMMGYLDVSSGFHEALRNTILSKEKYKPIDKFIINLDSSFYVDFFSYTIINMGQLLNIYIETKIPELEV